MIVIAAGQSAPVAAFSGLAVMTPARRWWMLRVSDLSPGLAQCLGVSPWSLEPGPEHRPCEEDDGWRHRPHRRLSPPTQTPVTALGARTALDSVERCYGRPHWRSRQHRVAGAPEVPPEPPEPARAIPALHSPPGALPDLRVAGLPLPRGVCAAPPVEYARTGVQVCCRRVGLSQTGHGRMSRGPAFPWPPG